MTRLRRGVLMPIRTLAMLACGACGQATPLQPEFCRSVSIAGQSGRLEPVAEWLSGFADQEGLNAIVGPNVVTVRTPENDLEVLAVGHLGRAGVVISVFRLKQGADPSIISRLEMSLAAWASEQATIVPCSDIVGFEGPMRSAP